MVGWRSTRDYRLWRVAILRRDVRCVICGSIRNRHAHHLNSGSYFPLERFDADNGVCVCGDCHMNFHNNFKRSYRTKCTKYDFDNFLVLIKYLRGKFNVFPT